jgi:hypothetical protein
VRKNAWVFGFSSDKKEKQSPKRYVLIFPPTGYIFSKLVSSCKGRLLTSNVWLLIMVLSVLFEARGICMFKDVPNGPFRQVEPVGQDFYIVGFLKAVFLAQSVHFQLNCVAKDIGGWYQILVKKKGKEAILSVRHFVR